MSRGDQRTGTSDFFLVTAFHFLLTFDLGLISIAKGFSDFTTMMTGAFENPDSQVAQSVIIQ